MTHATTVRYVSALAVLTVLSVLAISMFGHGWQDAVTQNEHSFESLGETSHMIDATEKSDDHLSIASGSADNVAADGGRAPLNVTGISSSTVDDPIPHATQVNIFHVGNSLESFVLTSPNGLYQFHLQSSGDLTLLTKTSETVLFSSNTAFYWPVEYHVELLSKGELVLTWSNEASSPYTGTPWTSALLPNCDPLSDEQVQANTLAGQAPVLELLDSGLLQIRSDEKVICTMHRAVGDPGRLALVYTGFLRTYQKTCAGHRDKLLHAWPGSEGVDVHIYSYLEEAFDRDSDAPTEESILQNLRACFGDNLKTVTLARLQNVSETWEDPPNVVLRHCGQDRLDRHLSQWKTIWAAKEQLQKYMIHKGIRYDYVLRTRLDLLLHGRIPEFSELVSSVQDGSVLAPRVGLDHIWYTMIHDGELIAGVTDVMSFGKAAQMWTYMNLYTGFKTMLALEKSDNGNSEEEQSTAAWSNFCTHGHRKLSVGDMELCTPEGSLAYWLSINNIPAKTDWRFGMGLLRNSGPGPRLGEALGPVKNTCPIPERTWLCPGL